MSNDNVKYPKIISDGDTFRGTGTNTFTVLGSSNIILLDSEGNEFGTYEAGKSYQGVMPTAGYQVSGGMIKLWG